MYCKNCGNQMDPDAAVCVKCGFQKGQGGQFWSALRRTDGAGRGLLCEMRRTAVCVCCCEQLNGKIAYCGGTAGDIFRWSRRT